MNQVSVDPALRLGDGQVWWTYTSFLYDFLTLKKVL